ncbi:hypothetical protein F5Y08DRAFT_306141 [Xylaria arbuscula]|nr:hypothetical protein F5Y08DRAFT_306141 [Xylaria arbuscula]
MASRGHISAAPRSTDVIDLTNDDSDTDATSTETTKPEIRLNHAVPIRHLPTINPNGQHGYRDHPQKRQRTGEPSPRYEMQEALLKCFEEQVLPHIGRATAQLSPDIYDVPTITRVVTRAIVTSEFEKSFRDGGWRLPASEELIIAARIPRNVLEIAQAYRRPTTELSIEPPGALSAESSIRPPTSSFTTATATASDRLSFEPPPRILPSIEKDGGDVDSNSISNKNHDGAHNNIGGFWDDANNGGNDYGYTSDAPDLSFDEMDEEGLSDIDGSDSLVQPNPTASTPPKRRPPESTTKQPQLSPQQLRTRAKANQWQSGKTYHPVSETAQPRLFGLPTRPYLSARERRQTMSYIGKPTLPSVKSMPSHPFHVDFSDVEVYYIQQLARKVYGRPEGTNRKRSPLRDLRNILKKVPSIITDLSEIHTKGYAGYDPPPVPLKTRSPQDVTNFLNDLYSKRQNAVPTSLFVAKANSIAQIQAKRANKIPALMLLREITGNQLGAARTYQNFITTAKSNREDYLEPQIEWTNCAGDIMTISWLSNTDFICGATTHSDAHNQQYNKPGNLLLGSAVDNTLRAYPDHRIVRPIVCSGDNSLESMVASQDPWLFTSVVSSDYDPLCQLAFTSSFDKTVKAWKLDGGSMKAVGTWIHEGRVNFVVASKTDMCTVTTAADVPTEAVRVYHVDKSDVSGSRYDSYSCTRVHDEDYVPSDKWAYYPAAIRWGLASDVNHLLLIGYSPRSPTGEDHEIPEDKLNSGELCLWDTKSRSQVKVNSAKTQNVFEVAWHPSRASFAAATSASQVLEKTEQNIRTQIRIFECNEDKQYGAIKTLDCTAIDINELSIMPNSLLYSYIAASCTDGKVYVWDTAGSDMPMCVLKHGGPIEELLGERDQEDVGVKFAAWATTPDRLYTGSSDGIVKVWNIRHGRGVLVRDLMEAAGPITYGAFSPDFTKLVIGDGSGRVYLLGLEDTEDEDQTSNPVDLSVGFVSVKTSSGSQQAIRRPRPFIPHPEVPPPHKLMEGQESARGYLQAAQVVLHPNPTIGAIQGVNYADTGLFRAEAHVNGDPNEPLLAPFQSKQQELQIRLSNPVFPRQGRQIHHSLTNGWQENHDAGLPITESCHSDDNNNRQLPKYRDFLEETTYLELVKEKAELDDRLIEFQYETSIADSDEDDEGDDDAEQR